jgi:hypothetical protein
MSSGLLLLINGFPTSSGVGEKASLNSKTPETTKETCCCVHNKEGPVLCLRTVSPPQNHPYGRQSHLGVARTFAAAIHRRVAQSEIS